MDLNSIDDLILPLNEFLAIYQELDTDIEMTSDQRKGYNWARRLASASITQAQDLPGLRTVALALICNGLAAKNPGFPYLHHTYEELYKRHIFPRQAETSVKGIEILE